MITVYKKNNIPKGKKIIKLNDVYFNTKTSDLLDSRAEDIISIIDKTKIINKYTIASQFDGTNLNIDKLSTGCKTALNILYNPDVIFDIAECGDNALDVIYTFDEGNIYCDYPMIAVNMAEVKVFEKDDFHVMKDYDNLKEWWMNEN
jgi:hypothetical protein